MKGNNLFSKKFKLINFVALSSLVLASPFAMAGHCKTSGKNKCRCHHEHVVVKQAPTYPNDYTQVATYKDMPVYTFVPHWYAGYHVGVSRAHDRKSAGFDTSVTQIGPGWTADIGYQFWEFYRATIAAELGFTQYHQSSENTATVNIANTEHFATYIAAVGQYPLFYNLGILGKLGAAYSYAKKVFVTGGASRSANTWSLYWGGGLTYNMTTNAQLVLQWARACGNNQTGSTDITTLGVSYGFM